VAVNALFEHMKDFCNEEFLKWKEENTPPITKVCTYCLIEQPIKNFQNNQKYYNRPDSRCKSCKKETTNNTNKLKKIAPPKPEFCDCCGKPKKLFLDHDHQTLEIRGWICNDCNTSLGKLGDDISGLKNALFYLERDKTLYNLRNFHVIKKGDSS